MVEARAIAGRGAFSSMAREHRPQPGWHPLDWVCEFSGTLLLVLGGLSAIVLNFGTGSPIAPVVSSHSERLLLTGLMFAGCGSLVALSPLGRRSGAHLNPSITIGFWCQHHLRLGDVAGYVISQCLGAIAGAAVVRLVFGARAASVQFGVTEPGRHIGHWQAAGVEAAMTATLVLTVFVFVSSRRTARWTPLAVWVLVAVLVWQGAPLTGTSLNLARSLGPALISGDWADYWIYVVGPTCGALCAVAVWTLIPRNTLTAKLFHDSRYQSVLGSDLPVRVGHPRRP